MSEHLKQLQVTVIGTGYVGLVSGACLAESGTSVTCVDVDAAKISGLQAGILPIYEPGLEAYVQQNFEASRLRFTTDLSEAAEADIIFLALPTPSDADGSADLSYVQAVASQLGPLLHGYTVVVNKSTVPVGTAREVADLLAAAGAIDFDVVSNPEFLREGHAVEDFMHPDRIVIGTRSERAFQIMHRLYEPFMADDETKLVHMDEQSAEMTKYAANSFLALKVSFMNEIANLCDILGADVSAVARGIGSDPRISPHFLRPGIGFGGSCFPKDVLALQQTAKMAGVNLRTLEAIVGINSAQKLRLVEKVRRHFDHDLHGRHFALWGLAFKPDTDDIREAPALEIIRDLTASGATVTAYDPQAMPNVRKYFAAEGLTLADDRYTALRAADALLIATEWAEFSEPDLDKLRQTLKQPLIFDGRNMYDPAAVRAAGFTYDSIGRPAADSV